ncbi:MAG: hypothetical protein GF344_13465 [Chitinivibrionales bacterium]|nr:hypothetical protein [Chitinivibrionales bacterium]MBD3357739.1 hypothetical protein [Chitinivibrionales bacterium]
MHGRLRRVWRLWATALICASIVVIMHNSCSNSPLNPGDYESRNADSIPTESPHSTEPFDTIGGSGGTGIGINGSVHRIELTLGSGLGTHADAALVTESGMTVVGADDSLTWIDPVTGSKAKIVSLGGSPFDIAASSNGTIGVIGEFGVRLFDSTGILRHHATTVAGTAPSSKARIDIAPDGTILVLLQTKTAVLLDMDLSLKTVVTLEESPTDMAVSSDLGLFFVCGFTQATSTLQIPWIHAYSFGGENVWTNYNKVVDGLMADSRCDILCMSTAGVLYMAGEQAGGGSPFDRDPQQPARAVSNGGPAPDSYQRPHNLNGSAHIAYIAQYDGSSGAWLKGTHLLGRLSNNKGNTVLPQALACDRRGAVYLGGKMAFAVANRDKVTINGRAMPGNGTFLAVFDGDFRRLLWITLGTDGDVVGVGAWGSQCAVVTGETGRGVLTDGSDGEGSWLGVFPLDFADSID